jgi:hypothetical protein
MSDSEIIWKFLDREYLDDNPVIYLYCNGNVRSPKTAVTKAIELTNKVFYPAMSEHLIQTVIVGFLENKKKLYKKGLIKIKPIYAGL